MKFLFPALAALALAACGDTGANTNGENGLEPNADGLLDPSAADPATANLTNLTVDSNASAVDQAVDQPETVPAEEAAGDALDAASNTAE